MPTPDQVLEQLRQLASKSLGLNLTPAELAAFNRLDEMAGLDSLTVLEFVTAVEKEFKVKFQESDLRADFLGDLRALSKHLAQRGEGVW